MCRSTVCDSDKAVDTRPTFNRDPQDKFEQQASIAFHQHLISIIRVQELI